MKSLGICFGATTIQAVVLHVDAEFKSVEKTLRIAHNGNPVKIFKEILAQVNCPEIERVAVTGRNFRANVRLSGISEVEAVECALREEFPAQDFPDIVISAGGETQLVYKVGSHGGIASVLSGNKCASGTGEFFLQQIRRMGLTLEEAVALAEKGSPHKIAGRCSVFCKSDCTHALNKGEKIENIMAGLCRMMADKIINIVKDTALP